MRILVCGDREWTDETAIHRELMKYGHDTVVIQGECRGADLLAASVAEKLGMLVVRYPADWRKYGRAAGHIRNKQMLLEGKPDLVMAFHPLLLCSKGTKNMVHQAKELGIEVRVFDR